MPPRCQTCDHPRRVAIEKAILAPGASIPEVAQRFAVSPDSLRRHQKNHLGKVIQKAQQIREQQVAQATAQLGALDDARKLDVYHELAMIYDRAVKHLDACDEWMRDPADPSRYNLDPRGREVEIVYLVEEGVTDRGKPIVATRKATLQTLLDQIAEKVPSWGGLLEVKWKIADPRVLLLKAHERIQAELELLARLLGLLKPEGTTVNVITNPQWIEIRSEIVAALEAHPEARTAVLDRLRRFMDGDGAAR